MFDSHFSTGHKMLTYVTIFFIHFIKHVMTIDYMKWYDGTLQKRWFSYRVLYTPLVVSFSSREHCLSIDSVQCSLEQSLLVHWNCEELEISNCTIMWVTHNLFLKRCDHLDRRPNCLSWVAKRV